MSTVHWAPWAQAWFDNDARRLQLVRKHKERVVKKALLAAKRAERAAR